MTKSIKQGKLLKCNITFEEEKALQELRKNDNIKILPADKGGACVVLDSTEYNNKVLALLQDTNTYQLLKKDPTSTHERHLTDILKEWKDQGKISDDLCQRLYSMHL